MERLVYNLFLLYFVNKIVIFLLLFRWYNVVEREEIIMSVLKLENVKKYYGVKNNITKAVDGISFQVDEGEFVAIMGASGSGKTTLLNCISTIDNVNSGHIYVGREDITEIKEDDMADFRRENLGFIFQDFNLKLGLSIEIFSKEGEYTEVIITLPLNTHEFKRG